MPFLSLQNVHKDFGGVAAVDGVDLGLAAGELRALVGPNGCGKSTVFNLISGSLRATAGRITLDGTELGGQAPHRIARLGVGRKFQVPSVFGDLTVAENLDLAGAAGDRWGSGARPQSHLADRVHLADKTGDLASVLSHGQRQWLEIGMVLAARPRLMLLDEPTAGMTAFETAATVDLIRTMAGENGATILVIEHDTGFLERLDCPVTVMAKGKILATGTYQEIHNDPQVRALYFGNRSDA
ncbi:MAG: ATP-binding cassette domain-containing protein [Alphaproteobacteria bacterium]|jgi:ABC-type uncharacterized transport system ATPase subunit|nr:ATP-binding cassette domain-containing protein [Alphaproteobacteria bacterium]MBT5859854.1 ATP-binding cassette domain-containing protein [Alphaproteobacteria bacterium]